MHLFEGEWIVADTSAECARFSGTDVPYQQSRGFCVGSLTFVAVAAGVDAMSNASRRHAAQQQAAVQRRDHQMLRMIVSTVPLICSTSEMGWAAFGYQAMTIIQTELPSRQVFFELDGPAQPMRIAASGAALASVMAIHRRYGIDGLRQHPGLEPIRRGAQEGLQREAQQRAQLAVPQPPAQAQQPAGATTASRRPPRQRRRLSRLASSRPRPATSLREQGSPPRPPGGARGAPRARPQHRRPEAGGSQVRR